MTAGMTSGRAVVRRTWRGSSIQLSQVVDRVNRLQLEIARLEAGEGEQMQSRSKVVDIVVVADTDTEAEGAASVLGELADRHPSRAVIILDQPGGRESRLDAALTVAAGASISCRMCEYEEVFLRVQGPVAAHIPSLVDSLLVSDVPGFLWWTGDPPVSSGRFKGALEVADVVVVDSAQFTRPATTYKRLIALRSRMGGRMVFADLAWARIHAWRELVAQCFNAPERLPYLDGVTDVRVAGDGIAAALLGGWLRALLPGGGRVPIRVERRSDSRGLASVRLAARHRRSTLELEAASDAAGDRVTVRGTAGRDVIAPRVIPLPPQDEGTLLSHLLLTARHDSVFERASAAAVELLR